MSNLSLRVVLAQINLTVGDITGNTQKIINTANLARVEHHADLVVFPELTLISYPPDDLLLRPGLYKNIDMAMNKILASLDSIAVVIGYPQQTNGHRYNTCALLHNGVIEAIYHKSNLPNYSVFDEKRYFEPGTSCRITTIKGIRVALSICEDIWVPDPIRLAAEAGANLMININASPFHAGKSIEREKLLHQRALDGGMAIIYLNLVGGQDELVFDGASMVVDKTGMVQFRAPEFKEDISVVEFTPDTTLLIQAPPSHSLLPEVESIYMALVMGVRDYVFKNGFSGAIIGLSGGIDSALTLALAVDALGADRVEAILMPSRYTAEMSVKDAELEAQTLGVITHTISIEAAYQAFLSSLDAILADLSPDTAEENIQARCRGVILMAISNKKHKLVLTTGTKSEMAVGYATLYGDMAGGFAPLKDVPKTLVYQLARWRNHDHEVIPKRVLERPPSAELAPNQKDTDTLPPYEVLDPILERYIERDQTPNTIIKAGFDATIVYRTVEMVDRNEYKRRQAAPGVRISRRAFGRERRYPITSAYHEKPTKAPDG